MDRFAASFVDLHAFLPSGYTKSSANGVEAGSSGVYVVGSAFNATLGRWEAVMWSNIPAPSGVALIVCVFACGGLRRSFRAP